MLMEFFFQFLFLKKEPRAFSIHYWTVLVPAAILEPISWDGKPPRHLVEHLQIRVYSMRKQLHIWGPEELIM